MAKEKAIGMPRAMNRKKAARPRILITRGDNLTLLHHLRNKVKHLDNAFEAEKESAKRNQELKRG